MFLNCSQYVHKRLYECIGLLVLEASHNRVDEGEVVEHALVHAVDKGTISDGKSGLLVYKLLVKVTAVAGGFL